MATRKRHRNPVPPDPSSISAEASLRPNATLAELASDWLKRRHPGQRQADTQRLRDHVLPLLGSRRVRDISADDVLDVVRRTLAKKGMNPKSAKNAYAAFSELLGDALARGLLALDPRALPPDTWPEEPTDLPRFNAAEAHALTHDERLDLDQRIYNLLAFRSGLDSPAICQLRFDSWREHLPAPPSPEVEAGIEHWSKAGFESVFGRPPTADDWLIPRRSDVSQPLTEGAAFKAFRRACVALEIKTRSPRAVRNTFAESSVTDDGGATDGSGA